MTLEPASIGSHRHGLATPWKNCQYCSLHFKSPREFSRHLRESHCSKEGGSYVCRYGPNNICPSLPLEGVSDMDYENHIARDHVQASGRKRSETQEDQCFVVSPPGTIPSVVHDQHRWTVFDSKVNLPAALNDPLRVKRETDFFTKTWGQEFYEKMYVPESRYLPEIDRRFFEKYKHRISKRYRRYARYKHQIDQEAPGGESFLQQMEKNRAELQQLPKLFMLSNFDLENSDTFNAVFPWSQVEECKKNGGSSQSSKLLQEKLSHYLDVVEVHIAKQISTKSDTFFQAVSSHDVLQENMLKTCQTIKQLRDKIHSIDELLTQGSLKIMKLSQTRANYVKLHDKLKLMSTVHQTQPTIQLLLSTQEFVGALDLISTTQEVLTQELAGVHSFRHLSSQLAELENIIEKMLQEDFAKCVSADLNRPVTDKEPLLEEEKIVSLVFGMLRKSRFNFVNVYREEAFTAFKAIVKQTVVEAVSEAENVDTEDENITSLADQMRMLNYSQWMELIKQIFSNLLVHLNRAK
ncbi:vacuolar protein sorting-associated protein 54-like, partial [Saccostrea cucullata]|uniref:vacuolar protein sorting-associated protein 54-like n=1 Tax=Saccostrea cuccullata TaxID=36930 RepID=UPI002ED4D4C1